MTTFPNFLTALSQRLQKAGFPVIKVTEGTDQCDASIDITPTISVQVVQVIQGYSLYFGVVRVKDEEFHFYPARYKLSDLVRDLQKAQGDDDDDDEASPLSVPSAPSP